MHFTSICKVCQGVLLLLLAAPQGDFFLVITHKLRLRESGLLDECAPQILRCAQDDSQGVCHPERSEGSVANLWVITRHYPLAVVGRYWYNRSNKLGMQSSGHVPHPTLWAR